MTNKRFPLGPVVVDRVSVPQALARIDGLVRHGRGGYVVTPTVNDVVLAQRLPRLREAYRQASLSLANGRPLRWMVRALGRSIPGSETGTGFIETLASHAVSRDWGVFLFGGTEDVSARAAAALEARYPGLRVVGRDTSAWPNSSPKALVRKIKESGAKIVIVDLGSPLQEAWMLQHADLIRPALAFGLGGALESLAGRSSTTPRWLARVGLSWLHRIVREPRRTAQRYLVQPPKMVPVLLNAVASRVARLRGADSVSARAAA